MSLRLLLLCVCLVPMSGTVPSIVVAQMIEGSHPLFQPDRVSEITLQFTVGEWAKLQPSEDLDWDIGRAFGEIISDASEGKEFRGGDENRPGLGGYLGLNHQYGKADLVIDGEPISNVGVRYKGNGSFLSGRALGKYSFKIDFNEYQDDLNFNGLKKVNLQNCASDPSMLREAVSYQLFREVGVSCPLTGWASVAIDIDGRVKQSGLYLVVEQVDQQFLQRAFGESDGLLVKPSAFTAFPYLGETWDTYESFYNPKTNSSPEQQQRIIEFARLIHRSDRKEFEARIGEYLDIDNFLSFLAVNTILSNLDSFLGGSQNYYAYLSPETNKVLLIPWDLDHSFGSLDIIGTPESRLQHSVKQPQIGFGKNRLIERMLEMPEMRKAYLTRVEQLLDSVFEEKKWIDQLDATAAVAKPALDDEEKLRMDVAITGGDSDGKGYSLKHFVRERRVSIRDQLEGRSEGQTNDFNEGIDPKLVLRMMGWGMAIAVAVFLNFVAWIWAIIAGFRFDSKWGLLNLLMYPLLPLVFGFFVSRKLGWRSAVMTLLCVSLMVGVFVPFIQTIRSF
ncbi:MAG: CotH kinase family protein [Rubripirellula sp.]